MIKTYGAGIAAALLCASALAQTAGVKLNHVVIAVRDLEKAKHALLELRLFGR